jgi:hypothetical protein
MTGTPRITEADLADLAEQQVDVVEAAEPPDPSQVWEADEGDVAEQQVEIGYDDEHEPG